MVFKRCDDAYKNEMMPKSLFVSTVTPHTNNKDRWNSGKAHPQHTIQVLGAYLVLTLPSCYEE